MSHAQLHIKGLKEPITISTDQGRHVDAIRMDRTIPDDYQMNVGSKEKPVFVGKKADIRYVTYEKSTTQSTPWTERFTADDVKKFEKEWDEHFRLPPQGTSMDQYWDFFVKKGAAKWEPYYGSRTLVITNTGFYEKLMELERVMGSLRARREFGERQAMREPEIIKTVEGVKASLNEKFAI